MSSFTLERVIATDPVGCLVRRRELCRGSVRSTFFPAVWSATVDIWFDALRFSTEGVTVNQTKATNHAVTWTHGHGHRHMDVGTNVELSVADTDCVSLYHVVRFIWVGFFCGYPGHSGLIADWSPGRWTGRD